MEWNNFTWMIWFKKRDPTLQVMPMIETMLGGSLLLHMWNDGGVNSLYCHVGNQLVTMSTQFDGKTWNHFAVSVNGNMATLVMNGTSTQTVSFVGDLRNDRFIIGRRDLLGLYRNGFMWDGCLAHVALFNKSLPTNEINMWSMMIKDDTF
jgi:hypothetical protein